MGIMRTVTVAAALYAVTAVSLATVPVTQEGIPVRSVVSAGIQGNDEDDDFSLPPHMLIGAGTSAFQAEGAWNESGKAESLVDHLFHFRQDIVIPGSHDVSADSYHHYKEDVAMAKALKLQLYRFSISWPRLLPTSDPQYPNEEGRLYYHRLLDEIIHNGMKPLVTLLHFDHPLALEREFGGWQSMRMVDKFVQYADYVFKEYGSKVKLWTTINEANVFCTYYKTQLVNAMMIEDEDWDVHRCLHHSLLAHGKAYRLYRKKYHAEQQGQVGWTPLIVHGTPLTASPQDVFAADLYNQATQGLVMEPLVHGDYPHLLRQHLSHRLYNFTDKEKAMLKGSADYMGLNAYTNYLVTYKKAGDASPESDVFDELHKDLPYAFIRQYKTSFEEIHPEALEKAVSWAWFQYKMPIMVAETGLGTPDSPDELHDLKRAAFHSAYLRAVLSASRRYNITLMGYCVWSLLDCFEWGAGYSRLFGLVHVDRTTLRRSLKDSSGFFVELADRRVSPYVADPSSSSSSSSSSAASGLPMPAVAGAIMAAFVLSMVILRPSHGLRQAVDGGARERTQELQMSRRGELMN